ncbi:MAG: helicase-associated domain-containing protein [Bacillota bacterium]|nr:helicase-associated domain-containing protein [Bacillota bacterium]
MNSTANPCGGLPVGNEAAVIRVRGLDTFLPPVPTLGECLAAAPPWYSDILEAAASPWYRDSSSRLAMLLDGLDPLEKTAFWLVGAFNAGRGIPVEQCWSTLAEVTGHRHRRFSAVLDSLRRKGLVFVGHHNYRSVYFIPGDLRAAAEELFFRPAVAGAALSPGAFRPLPYAATALRDMHLFLLAVARGEISLTREGDIYRRQQVRLARLLGWPTCVPVQPETPREDYLAARLSLLWSYALSRALVLGDGGSVVLTTHLETWLDLTWGERWADMVAQTLYGGASWTQDAFTALQLLLWSPPGTWLPLGRVLPQRDQMPSPHGPFHPLGQLIHRLQYLGLVEEADTRASGPGGQGPGVIGKGHADAAPALRLTPLGRAYLEALFGQRAGIPTHLLPGDESSFIVAPNFEVVATFNLHPRLLLKLGMLADPVQADQALLFRISRNSIYRGLRRGVDGDAIVGILSRGNGRPLPQNVEASIREWAAAYGQVWMARFHLLRCRDAEIAARLKASPRVQPFLAGELTPQDLILREGDLRPLQDVLEREGLLPHADLELAPPLDGPAPSPAGPQVNGLPLPGPGPANTPARPSAGAPPPDPPPASAGAAAGTPLSRLVSTLSLSGRPMWRDGDAPPPIRILPSDWFDLAGRR